MPVRLDEISNSIVDTCLKFVHVLKKKMAQFTPTFFIISTLKGDVRVNIFHFTNFFLRPYVKKGDYRIEFVCGNVIF